MIDALKWIYLGLSVVLLALMVYRWLWWRYPIFALLLVADAVKYSLWSFGHPDVYVLADLPTTILRVLAAAEVVARSVEWLTGQQFIWGLIAVLVLLFAIPTITADVRETSIQAYNHGRLILHTSVGGCLLAFAALRLRWPATSPTDGPHSVLLGLLCFSMGVADIVTVAELDLAAWELKVTAFRAVRVILYACWVEYFWPSRPHASNSPDARAGSTLLRPNG